MFKWRHVNIPFVLHCSLTQKSNTLFWNITHLLKTPFFFFYYYFLMLDTYFIIFLSYKKIRPSQIFKLLQNPRNTKKCILLIVYHRNMVFFSSVSFHLNFDLYVYLCICVSNEKTFYCFLLKCINVHVWFPETWDIKICVWVPEFALKLVAIYKTMWPL